MDSCASVSSCSSSSGEISSAKPVKVHMSCYLAPEGSPPLSERGSSVLVPFLGTYGPAGTGRFVDCLDYREGLASFFEVHERLAALPYGLDEVLDLVAVRHGEAGWVRAGAKSGAPFAIPLHHTLGLVLADVSAVGVFPVLLAGGMKVPQLVVVDDGRSPVPVHGYPGRKSRICRRGRDDGAEGASCELQDGYRRVFDLDPLVGE